MQKFAGQSVGQILKQQRDSLGLTVAEISAQTHIRENHVNAIEASDFAAIGSPVYIKGMLGSYAKAVGIDPGFILRLYKREQQILPRQAKAKHIGYNISRQGVFALVGVTILLLFGAYLYAQVSKTFELPNLQIEKPVAQKADGAITELMWETNLDRVKISGRTSVLTVVTVNSIPLRLNQANEFESEELPLPSSTNKIRITATNQFGRTSEILLTIKRIF